MGWGQGDTTRGARRWNSLGLVAATIALMAGVLPFGTIRTAAAVDSENGLEDPLADLADIRADGPINVCHGFNCNFRTQIVFSRTDRTTIAGLMRAGRTSPAAERIAVGKLLVWFDRRIGPEAETTGHIARAGAGYAGDPHQFDCIDTTHNTLALLEIIARNGLLVHHRPSQPASRGPIPHEAATMEEKTSGARWAVDPWTHRYGEAPDILPLDTWQGAG